MQNRRKTALKEEKQELKSVLLNFRRIDDIPENQNKRDKICAKTDPPSVKQ